MTWSPRQLGELADTSRRAVRHYQDIGLLPEPQRQSNGYGQYGVAHLIRLLRIRRLTQLGFTLPQIAAMGSDDVHPAGSLRELDAELRIRIQELHDTRMELATMLQRAAPTDLPVEIASHASGLPPAERALLVVLSRVLRPEALQAYVDLLLAYRQDPAATAFDDLVECSDEQSRRDLASDIAKHVRQLYTRRADCAQLVCGDLRTRARAGAPTKQHTVDAAIRDLYNPAQLDVLVMSRRRLSASSPGLAPTREVNGTVGRLVADLAATSTR